MMLKNPTMDRSAIKAAYSTAIRVEVHGLKLVSHIRLGKRSQAHLPDSLEGLSLKSKLPTASAIAKGKLR